jgi:hypothetical protein
MRWPQSDTLETALLIAADARSVRLQYTQVEAMKSVSDERLLEQLADKLSPKAVTPVSRSPD